MKITNEQAAKIATMMLQAATYQEAWIELHPIETRREGRDETYQAIAKALSVLTGVAEEDIYKQLEWSNGQNSMELRCAEEQIAKLRNEYQAAPVYQDAKGRQYFMFQGVRTQDFCYQKIDVVRYVDFQPTGGHRDIDKIRKRLQRESDLETLDVLEETGEIEDIDPISIQHLYH